MPRYRLSDMDFDEVSTVDVPANQFSRIVLAKRHQEDGMPADQSDQQPEEIFDAEGTPVAYDDLQPGDVVQDAAGNLYEWTEAEQGEQADEPELAEVGKSAFLDSAGAPAAPSNEVLAKLSAELSKALNDEQRQSVVSKAVQGLVQENQTLAKRVSDFEALAKRERTIRLEREYIAKADTYNVPVAAEDLGPVLMRMAESMSYEDCAVIDKALTASGEIFTELGLGGESDTNDPFAQIEELASEEIGKRNGDSAARISKEQATVEFFDSDPEAYNRYRNEQARS